MSTQDHIHLTHAFIINSGLYSNLGITLPDFPSIGMKEKRIREVISSQNPDTKVRRDILKLIYDGVVRSFDVRLTRDIDGKIVFHFAFKRMSVSFTCPFKGSRTDIFNDTHFIDLLGFINQLINSHAVGELNRLITDRVIDYVNMRNKKGDVCIACLVKKGVFIWKNFEDAVTHFNQIQVSPSIIPNISSKPEMESSPSSSSSSQDVTVFSPLLPPSSLHHNIYLRIGDNVGIYEIQDFNSASHHVHGKLLYNATPLSTTKLFSADVSAQGAWLSFLFKFRTTQDPKKHYLFVIDAFDGILEELYNTYSTSFTV